MLPSPLVGLEDTKPIGLCGACNTTMTSENLLKDEVNLTMTTRPREEELCGEAGVGLPRRSRNWTQIEIVDLCFVPMQPGLCCKSSRVI